MYVTTRDSGGLANLAAPIHPGASRRICAKETKNFSGWVGLGMVIGIRHNGCSVGIISGIF